MTTISVSITKGEGGFGMRISVEGVVTGYSVPGGAAEVRTPLASPLTLRLVAILPSS